MIQDSLILKRHYLTWLTTWRKYALFHFAMLCNIETFCSFVRCYTLREMSRSVERCYVTFLDIFLHHVMPLIIHSKMFLTLHEGALCSQVLRSVTGHSIIMQGVLLNNGALTSKAGKPAGWEPYKAPHWESRGKPPSTSTILAF